MICQNCHSKVDDDLIFCTNCGVRLIQPSNTAQNQTEQPTLVLPNQTEQTTAIFQNQEKKQSKLKWILLIIGIITVPIVLGIGIFTYYSLNSNKEVSQKTTPKPTPTAKKKNTNQNKSANIVVNNTNTETNSNADIDTNSNSNSAEEIEEKPDQAESVIVDDTVTVDADEYVAFPFNVKEDGVTINGKVEILDGENYEGYVFIKEVFDEYKVNPGFKMFSFEEKKGKIAEVKQYLIKGDYVLVFKNSDGKGVQVKAEFTQTPYKF